jgi:hypothetical protein
MLIALQDVLGLSMAVIVSPAGYGRDMAMLADVLCKYPDRLAASRSCLTTLLRGIYVAPGTS